MKNGVITSILAAGTAAFSALIGQWDKSLEILSILMVIDYITGITSAFMSKTLRSSTGYEGIIKKGTMFLIVILAAQVDRLTTGNNDIFRTCTTYFFIANEILSIFENAKKIGIEIPSSFEKTIQKYRRTYNEFSFNQQSDHFDQLGKASDNESNHAKESSDDQKTSNQS